MREAASTWTSNIYRSDVLPPTTVSKSVKESKKWQKAMMDSLEHQGLKQLRENLHFVDYYKMVEGDMSMKELSEVIPHLEGIEELLDGVGVPTFLKHYDLIGIIVKAIVGKYIDFQSKYHVTDTGEVAENDLLRHKNEQIQGEIANIVNSYVELKMAEQGISPEGQEFSSPEEQQQFMEELEQRIEALKPKDSERDTKVKYKTAGVRWGEATVEKDKEAYNILNFEKEELKDRFLTGRYFRHYRLRFDNYEPERWDPRNTFFSKEMDSKYPQKGEFIGRIHFMTPAEVIRIYGHKIDSKTQKELLGGNTSWSNFVGDGQFAGSIGQALRSNFVKPQRVPFSNFYDYNLSLGIQDELGIPMGEFTEFGWDGTTKRYDHNISRMIGDTHGRYNFYARMLRDDFDHRLDLCQVTEAYFRAYDLHGYLTYENDFGRVVTEVVTEDILPKFLKDKGIKQIKNESLEDIVENFEVNTIKWFYKPVVYEGVKIQSGNLNAPIYLDCKPCAYQIKGDSEFDTLLPVAGYIGKSEAKRMIPHQEMYNLCMNQVQSLLEKELGMFFLLDIGMIPSEFEGQGDAMDALVNIRNAIKDTGILPITPSADSQRNGSNFNQLTSYKISYVEEIGNRISLAETYKRKAFEVIGINLQMLSEPSKYETAEGVRQSAEASFAQISELYEDFGDSNRLVWDMHLNVAQYAQSNKKDLSVMYTKGDASIEFLKMTDPDFPLRRIGLMMSEDSKKRKELEEFRTYLMQTNTVGDDTLEIARLLSSDSMREILEIAQQERDNRERSSELAHQRQVELEQQRIEAERQAEIDKWERNEVSKEADRKARKEIEAISAAGRASSKDATTESFDQIKEFTRLDIQQQSLNQEAEKTLQDFKLREKEKSEEFKLRMKQLELQAQSLAERAKDRKSKEYVAQINKN